MTSRKAQMALIATLLGLFDLSLGASLRLTFSVDHHRWQLRTVTLLTESVSVNWPEAHAGYYLALENEQGELFHLQPIGRSQLRFYDYLDDSGNLTGEVREEERFSVSVKLPDVESDYRLKIYDLDSKAVYETGKVDILSVLSERKSLYPIYSLDTLVNNGDPAKKIDILILGDGYVLADTSIFLVKCNNHVNHTFGIVPFSLYSERFNVYAITTISNERGADHPESGIYKDTYYNSEYWGRLIGCDYGIAYGVADQYAPQYDEIWMLVQDPTYGGSGGGHFSISYAGGVQVMTHEFGHSFGALWDEYTYGGTGTVGNAPNCDDHQINPKWQAWIDSGYPGVGTYLSCSFDNAYRPTYGNCMMLALMNQFCIVCTEYLIKRLYEDAPDPIDYSFPAQQVLLDSGETQVFTISYANQGNYPLEISWFINNVLQPGSTGTDFTFTFDPLAASDITVQLLDTTSLELIVPDSVMTTRYTWSLYERSSVCGDVNGSGVVNISDVVFLIAYIFSGGPPPLPLISGDVNCSGPVNISDAVYLIAFIFSGGPSPCQAC